MSGGGVTISPAAISVVLAAGVDITVPVCAIAATRSNHKQVQVTALASGRESNTQQGQVNKNGGFTVIIEQFARLSISADQPYSEFCRDSILNTSFTVLNYGNWVDTILLEVLNQKDLENAGFTVALSQPLIELDSQGDMTVPITVRAGNATKIVEKGNYTLIVKASTTLVGETEARSVTATLHIIECEEIAEGDGGGNVATVLVTQSADGSSYYFEPAVLQVSVGDTVEFVWYNGSHNIVQVSDAEATLYESGFRSGDPVVGGNWTLPAEYTATNGTLEYVCEPHVVMDMRGTIIVGSGAAPDNGSGGGDDSSGDDADGDLQGLPAPSLAAAVAAVAVIALFRPRKP
jgi:plastocyanin